MWCRSVGAAPRQRGAAYDESPVVGRSRHRCDQFGGTRPVHVVDLATWPERAGCVLTPLPGRGQPREPESVEVGVTAGMDHMAGGEQPSDELLEATHLASVPSDEPGSVLA